MIHHQSGRLSRRTLIARSAGAGATALLAAQTGPAGGRTLAQGTPAAEVEVRDTARVGIVTSLSGPLQSYGEQYVEGFEVGLDVRDGRHRESSTGSRSSTRSATAPACPTRASPPRAT